MEQKKLNTILVGLGQMGQVWLGILLDNPSINIVALVDVNTEAAKAAANSHSLSQEIVFPALDDALKAGLDPKIAVDVTPPFVRSKIVTEALKNGLYVLSEKPMGMSEQDLENIYETAKSQNSLYMISQNYRWSSAAGKIKEIIQGGKIGKISEINIEFNRDENFQDFRANLDNPLLIDMAIHHFDLIRCFTGSNCKTVFCREYNPENSHFKQNAAALALLEMENGEKVTYNGNWASNGLATNFSGSWLIKGDLGQLSWDGGYKIILTTKESIDIFNIEKETSDKLAISLSYFIDSINSHEDPETGYKDNINTMKIVLAAIQSSQTKRTVIV